MGSIGRYIFRTTLGAFLVVLISVTALMWITQALRDIDLMTNQGQTILVFIGITGLIIPLLVLIIAPIALMIAVAHVLIKLSNDSELIVVNAAGMQPWQVFRPFFAVAIVVSLLVAAISVYISPKCLRELRNWAAQVRADLVTTVAQPGRFTVLNNSLTLHMQARQPNGQLVGVFVDDQRNPRERMTILAEYGNILKNEHGTFLLLENGSIQRQEAGQRDPQIVEFDRNAFDLSRLTAGPTNVRYSVRERYLWELLNPIADDPLFSDRPDQVRAELHDRLTAPLYPLALVLVTFAYLGAPRTTRQSRAMSLVGAIGMVALLRGLGFVGTVAGSHTPALLLVPYLALFAAFILSFWAISRGVIIEPPAFINNAITAVTERLTRRFAAATGAAQ
jgi:lipopolysaccharide export system permease protein